MVGKTGNFQILINETLVYRYGNRVKIDGCMEVLKDGVETLNLLGIFGQNKIVYPFFGLLIKGVNEQRKILVETGLRTGLKDDGGIVGNWLDFVSKTYNMMLLNILNDLIWTNESSIAEYLR